MKLSIFNTYLRGGKDALAIYNSLTDRTALCKSFDWTNANLNELSATLADCLKECGCLVEDGKDEVADYISKARDAEFNSTTFHLIVNPTLDCNFRCPYCYEEHARSKMSPETLERIKLFAKNTLERGQGLVLSFFGGEPLLRYAKTVAPLAQYCHRLYTGSGHRFSFNATTNGFLLSEKRMREMKEWGFTGAQITLDGDKEAHNRIRFAREGQDTFSRIISNILAMAKNGLAAGVRINCTSDNAKTLQSLPQHFSGLTEEEKRCVSVDFQTVWQEPNKEAIVPDIDKAVGLFREMGIRAHKRMPNGFCYGDMRNSCIVNHNGDVYKCTAMDFRNVPREGFITEMGTLEWENNSLEKRMSSKFTNPPCLKCRLLPLCHGGCTKHSMSARREYCLNGFDEDRKDRVVMDRIAYNYSIRGTL
ncbi:MAG: radical SAM protein [Bacteroidales bacterium]|nr:radical SAM protein [Bacteroidales bacterium]